MADDDWRMKYVDEFRDDKLAREIATEIRQEASGPLKFMEVCGTHTMAIARHGIRSILPENVRLISGPGCPVCVTPQWQIDSFIELGKLHDTILATFGDMIRVPGTCSSLEVEKAHGADVRIVYSPLDALEIARVNPTKRVVFFAVGFETTVPAVALAIIEANKLGIGNFFVLCGHKLIPPAMMALATDPEIKINGFICPGHVSAIIGSAAYEEIVRLSGIPCVVAGFEPLDILQSILMLVRQVVKSRAEVENQYSRVVTREGNVPGMKCIYEVFEVGDAEWRGLGIIPRSGLRLRPEYARFDARQFLSLPVVAEHSGTTGCECGSILKGVKSPLECRLFGKRCTPEHPLGPCMVSSEGACAAEYRYAR